jgi:hypothetical protein
VLQITDGIDNPGGMQWELVGFLALAWFLIYIVVWRGLQNSGKVTNLYRDVYIIEKAVSEHVLLCYLF